MRRLFSPTLCHLLLLALTACSTLAAPSVIAWGRSVEGQINVPFDLTNAVAVSAGSSHSLALRTDGTVAAWGSGAGTNVPPGLTNAVAIAAGGGFSLALRADQSVIGWGYAEVIPPVGLTQVVAIAVGQSHGVALRRDGTVVCWGDNTYGQTNVPENLTNVVEISAGARWSLARLRSGALMAWGLNGNSQSIIPAGTSNVVALASGTVVTLALSEQGTVVAGGPSASGVNAVPPSATNITFIAAGASHSLSIRNDGTPLLWGDNSEGQTNVPAELTQVVALAGGFRHSVALMDDLTPRLWKAPATNTVIYSGNTLALFAGSVGLAPQTVQWQHRGTNVPGASGPWLFLDNAQLADAGDYSVMVSNVYGTASSQFQVSVVDAPPAIVSQPITQTINAGGAATLTVQANGSGPLRYEWLRNGRAIPGATNSTLTLSNATTLEAGIYSVRVANAFGEEFSAVARITVPNVVAWGNSAAVPTNATDIVAIAAGVSGSLFLGRDGTLVGSGNNSPILTNVALVASGDYHGLASLSNGTIIAWGLNSAGQTNVPAGLHDVAMLAGGEMHSVALQRDGTAVEWGRYGSGAGGAQPAQVPQGVSNVMFIAAGHRHTLARTFEWIGCGVGKRSIR